MKLRLFLLFICLNLWSQKKSASDIEFEKLQYKIERIMAPEKTKVYTDELVSKASGSEQLYAKALTTLAIVNYQLADTKKALSNNKQSYLINKKLKNEAEIAKNYTVFGRIYEYNSDYVASIKYYLKSVDLCKKLHLNALLRDDYLGLGNNYLIENNHKTSLNYFLLAVDLEKKHPNAFEKAENYAQIGICYAYMKKTDLAEKYFDAAYSYYKKNNYDLYMAGILVEKSNLYYETDLLKAIELQLKAQKTYDKFEPNSPRSAYNIVYLGEGFFDLAKNDSLIKKIKYSEIPKSKQQLLLDAETYYKRALSINKKNKSLEWILTTSGLISDLQAYKGDYKNAYQNLQYKFKFNDSLFSQKNKNTIAKFESEKEIALKNKEIQLNKLTIQNKEKQKWFFMAGILLLGIIGILLFRQNLNRKSINQKLFALNLELDKSNKQLVKLNAELDESNTTKIRFFNIINHDLRRPIANLIQFLHFKKDSPNVLNEEKKKELENKTILETENLLISMEDILLWSKGQMENFKPEYKSININSLFEDCKVFFLNELKTTFIFENPKKIAIITDENYLKTIVRNLTSNGIKATTNIENPTILWKAWQENNQKFLSITDNGEGATQDHFKALYNENEIVGVKTGLGLHLIRDLAKAIDCEIRVDSKVNEGTTIILKLS